MTARWVHGGGRKKRCANKIPLEAFHGMRSNEWDQNHRVCRLCQIKSLLTEQAWRKLPC